MGLKITRITRITRMKYLNNLLECFFVCCWTFWICDIVAEQIKLEMKTHCSKSINYTSMLVNISKVKYVSLLQVETVGDKYMAVSGLPDACENHAKCIAKLALDIMDMAKNVKMNGEPVVSTWSNFIEILKINGAFLFTQRVTIGIHSGEVVTGVIGNRMPRYCEFFEA